MLIVKIYGGLAGQMMQYAFASFLELNKKEHVKIDLSFFGGQTRSKSFRKFELLNWNTRFSIATDEDYNIIFSDLKMLDKLKYKVFKKEVQNTAYFNERLPFCYDSEVLNENHRIYDGYWVNSHYMSQVEGKLKKEFTPRYPIDEKNKSILDKIENSNSVSIHFRRGDYVGSVHDVLKPDYYKKAVDYMNKHIENLTFFVFSDDLSFVKNNYDFSERTVFVDYNRGEEAYWDIFLMSKCQHNVIANSGFSYWGAWLNANPDKRIVAPADWMQTENKIEENLLLPNWHIL